jgi:hypothetical protein
MSVLTRARFEELCGDLSVHRPPKEDDTMISVLVSSWVHSYDIITHFLYRRYLVAATFDAAPLDPSSKPQDDYESPKNRMIETKLVSYLFTTVPRHAHL